MFIELILYFDPVFKLQVELFLIEFVVRSVLVDLFDSRGTGSDVLTYQDPLVKVKHGSCFPEVPVVYLTPSAGTLQRPSIPYPVSKNTTHFPFVLDILEVTCLSSV